MKENNNTPNFFIIGLPKSGTTALQWLINQHPDIFMTEPKEPYYFSTDFHREVRDFYAKENHIKPNVFFPYANPKEYFKLYEGVSGEKAVGEASVHYIFSNDAPRNIYEHNPNSKIIICLRSPSGFIRSWYQWNKYTWLADGSKTLEEALSLEKKRKNGSYDKVLKPPISHLFYIELCNYAKFLKNYLKYFSSHQIKIIYFEEMVKNNEETCKEVFKFLDVDENFTPRFEKVNESTIPRFIFLRKLSNSKVLQFLRKNINNSFAKQIYKKMMYGKQQKIVLDAPTLSLIRKSTSDYTENLEQLIQKNNLDLPNKNLFELWHS